MRRRIPKEAAARIATRSAPHAADETRQSAARARSAASMRTPTASIEPSGKRGAPPGASTRLPASATTIFRLSMSGSILPSRGEEEAA